MFTLPQKIPQKERKKIYAIYRGFLMSFLLDDTLPTETSFHRLQLLFRQYLPRINEFLDLELGEIDNHCFSEDTDTSKQALDWNRDFNYKSRERLSSALKYITQLEQIIYGENLENGKLSNALFDLNRLTSQAQTAGHFDFRFPGGISRQIKKSLEQQIQIFGDMLPSGLIQERQGKAQERADALVQSTVPLTLLGILSAEFPSPFGVYGYTAELVYLPSVHQVFEQAQSKVLEEADSLYSLMRRLIEEETSLRNVTRGVIPCIRRLKKIREIILVPGNEEERLLESRDYKQIASFFREKRYSDALRIVNKILYSTCTGQPEFRAFQRLADSLEKKIHGVEINPDYQELQRLFQTERDFNRLKETAGILIGRLKRSYFGTAESPKICEYERLLAKYESELKEVEESELSDVLHDEHAYYSSLAARSDTLRSYSYGIKFLLLEALHIAKTRLLLGEDSEAGELRSKRARAYLDMFLEAFETEPSIHRVEEPLQCLRNAVIRRELKALPEKSGDTLYSLGYLFLTESEKIWRAEPPSTGIISSRIKGVGEYMALLTSKEYVGGDYQAVVGKLDAILSMEGCGDFAAAKTLKKVLEEKILS